MMQQKKLISPLKKRSPEGDLFFVMRFQRLATVFSDVLRNNEGLPDFFGKPIIIGEKSVL